MIIYGYRTRESVVGTGQFPCPNCRTVQFYEHFVLRFWFTLYFLPLIPLHKQGSQVRCCGCRSRFSDEILQAATSPLESQFPTAIDSQPVAVDLLNEMPNPYLAQPQGTPPQPVTRTPMAIASLILAITSPFLLFICGLSLISSLLAIVFGHIARSEIKNSNGQMNGEGMALGGLIGGYVFLCLSVLWIGSSVVSVFGELDKRPVARQVPDVPDFDERAITNKTDNSIADPANAATDPRLNPNRKLPDQQPLQPGLSSTPDSNPLSTMTREQRREKMLEHQRRMEVDMQARFDSQQAAIQRGGFFPGDTFPSSADPNLGAPAYPLGLPDPAMLFDVPPPPGYVPRSKREVERKPGVSSTTPETPASTSAQEPPNPVRADMVHRFPDMGWGVQSLAFSPDQRWLAAGKSDEFVQIFSLEDGARRSETPRLRDIGAVSNIAFSPDGKTIVLSGQKGAVAICPFSDDGELGDVEVLIPHQESVEAMDISPLAGFIMSGADGKVMWQSYGTQTSKSKRADVFPSKVAALFAPVNGFLALATDGNELATIDLRNSEISNRRPLGSKYQRNAAFSNNGTKLAFNLGRSIEVYDTDSGKLTRTLQSKTETQWSVLFHPNNQYLFSGGSGKVTSWKLSDGTIDAVYDFESIHYIKSLAVSHDGRLLSAIPGGAGQTLKVIRLPNL
ncbi:MAG: DUF4190 domain-containing protein [Pirellulaceae bacterium]